MDYVRMSKTLAWLLRHGAVEQGMRIERDGSVLVTDVLGRDEFRGVSWEDLQWLVADNQKKRFEMYNTTSSPGTWRIRAVQGWGGNAAAIDDDVALEEIRTARDIDRLGFTCCHGTWHEYWPAIKAEGLKVMGRKHIHFACHVPGAGEVISGMRTECEVLIFLDTERFFAAGGKLFLSTNNVLNTDGFEGVIPPEFFKRAVQRRPTMGQLWPERGQGGHIPGMAPSAASAHAKPRVTKQPKATAPQAAHATPADRLRGPAAGGGDRVGGARGPAEASAATPAAEDNDKKAKRLAKTLAAIERTEEKQRAGQALTPEELDKLRRKPELERELGMLRGGRAAVGPAVADAWDDQPGVASPPAQAAPVPDSWEEPVQEAKEATEEATASFKSGAAAAKVELPPESATAAAEDPEKKARRLAKLLSGIERLEEKQRQGQALSPEESDKVKRKPEVERELCELPGGASTAEGAAGRREVAAAKAAPKGGRWKTGSSG